MRGFQGVEEFHHAGSEANRDRGRIVPGGDRCAVVPRPAWAPIAVFLGLAIVPLVGAIGIGVDTARGFLVRSRLSQALDAAALAGGRVMFETYRDQDVTMYFTSNFPNGFLGATVGTPVITDDGAGVPDGHGRGHAAHDLHAHSSVRTRSR